MTDGDRSSDAAQLAEFVRAFRRGIDEEIAAMRDRFGAVELALSDGVEVDDASYEFAFMGASGQLGAGDECSLKTPGREWPATILSLAPGRIRVRGPAHFDPTAGPVALVSAPWFLHSRLIEALERLDVSVHAVERGLALFGKRAAHHAPRPLRLPHEELNPSQRAAVGLTVQSDLSFIWGPPGTGKTTTLAHIVLELVAHGERVLLTSTTNAALDQALAKLAGHDGLDLAAGAVVRLGTSDAATYGCQLDALSARLQGANARALVRLTERTQTVAQIVDRGQRLCAKLAKASEPQQSLFSAPAARVAEWELEGLMPPAMLRAAASLTPLSFPQLVDRRTRRFKRLAGLLRDRSRALRRAQREGARAIVADASVVLATLAHVYLSPVLRDDQFDVVIVDEASMATLPTLFFAACLGRNKTVVVGDPRQLPPIVTADSRLAERVLGRNIFNVTVPDPHASPLVALLDTQYRMVPAIGDLVGQLFYDGRLNHGATHASHITAAEPFANEAVVVVDTSGETHCERGPGGRSRVNTASAAICTELAARASGGQHTVAIITPYAAQARAIRAGLDAAKLPAVECSTIHRFQGQERDVVIIDLVDTADMQPSLLLSERATDSNAACLLNVSISRAVGKLVLVADVGYFAARLPDSVAHRVLVAAAKRGVVRPAGLG